MPLPWPPTPAVTITATAGRPVEFNHRGWSDPRLSCSRQSRTTHIKSISCRVRIDDVELDPVEQGVVTDGTGVSGSFAEGFEVGLAGASQVDVIN